MIVFSLGIDIVLYKSCINEKKITMITKENFTDTHLQDLSSTLYGVNNDPREHTHVVRIGSFDGGAYHFFSTKEEVLHFIIGSVSIMEGISTTQLEKLYPSYKHVMRGELSIDSFISELSALGSFAYASYEGEYEDWKKEKITEYVQDYLVDDDEHEKAEELEEEELFDYYFENVFDEDEFIEWLQEN